MLSTFIARYDTGLLRPPATPAGGAAAAPLAPPEQALQDHLLAWCRHGAGDGRSVPPQPLSIAVLTGAAADAQQALVEDLALRLDGTYDLLAAGSRWRQRLFRLRVKWDECRWWRPRAAAAPWDSGYLINSAGATARLAHFRPRRPTLIVAQGLADTPLRDTLRTLATCRTHFAQPVRLLVLAPSRPAALGHWQAQGIAASAGALSFQALAPAAGWPRAS
jgi:hypothetical protein